MPILSIVPITMTMETIGEKFIRRDLTRNRANFVLKWIKDLKLVALKDNREL